VSNQKPQFERQTIRCQKQGQKDKQYDVKNKDKKTNNTMSKTRTKRQTIRCQKQGQKDKHYDVKNKDKKTNNGGQNTTQKTKD
jgi:hypothetical protein